MDTNNQARALMMRHQLAIRNRQATMLNRAAAEIGMDTDGTEYLGTIQGKVGLSFRTSYDRSGASLS